MAQTLRLEEKCPAKLVKNYQSPQSQYRTTSFKKGAFRKSETNSGQILIPFISQKNLKGGLKTQKGPREEEG